MVRESTPSQSCQLVAQHEALTDKLTILFLKKGALSSRTAHPVQTQYKTRISNLLSEQCF